MERDISDDRTSLRAVPVDADATQVRNSSHATTRLGPIDPDATFVRPDDPTSARLALARSVPGLRAAPPPPSAHVRAAEARARRDRLSASFTSTPSGRMTLRPPPLDLSADQTVDPPARFTRPTRTMDSFAPARVSFPPPEHAPPGVLRSGEELRDTARRPLALPTLTQRPAYPRSNAPSSVVPVAVTMAPASVARADRASRAQTFLLAALLVIGIGTTGVMGAATFAPGSLARGRASASARLDTLLGHSPRSPIAEAPPAPTYVEVVAPTVIVPPVLAESAVVPADRDAGR